MEKCHLRIKFNQQNEKTNYMIMFCEDNTIGKPNFIKNPTIEHTIQSRWITPCRVIEKFTELNDATDKCYNAYYHPLAYQLAKNQEFQRIIIENAIENVSIKKSLSELKYNIVPELEDIKRDYLATKPKYSVTLFTSVLTQQKFFQLIIWLPFIISSNSIIIETTQSQFFLQTDKPHKYKLSLSWPVEFGNFQICFSNFLRKTKQLAVLIECLNHFASDMDEISRETQVNEQKLIDGQESKSLKSLPNEYQSHSSSDENACENENNIIESEINLTESYNVVIDSICDPENAFGNKNDLYFQNEFPYEQEIYKSSCSKRKTHRVKFNSSNHCLTFEENASVIEIKANSGKSVPMKTKDGCSAKKFNYHMHKNSKNHDKSSNKSTKSKRNNNKKKKH